ncbi:putative skeletal organic matrix protein 2 [Oculina patagonica]
MTLFLVIALFTVDAVGNKVALYAAIGGFFNSSKDWFLMQGNMSCCNTTNCNTKVPTIPHADTRYCNFCVEPDAATCLANQRNQTCTTDPESFGTTHCASAVVKYEDRYGKALSGFIRGCINCANKRTACAVIRSDVKRFYNWTLQQCEIECCSDNNCNDYTPTFPPKALAKSAASLASHHVFFGRVLVFEAAFVNILYHV